MTRLLLIICFGVFSCGWLSAQTAILPEDADYPSRIFYGNQFGFTNHGGETVKLHFPDDPELGRLHDKQNADTKTLAAAQNLVTEMSGTLFQSKRNFARHILESRLAEIRSLQPKISPNDSNNSNNNSNAKPAKLAKLSDFDFPELDGSTSCEYLGKIIVAKILGIPYSWKPDTNQPIVYATGSDNFIRRGYFEFDKFGNTRFDFGGEASGRDLIPWLFRIVADENQVSFRRQKFFEEYFGHFQGTHESYMSLLAAKLKESKLPPETIKDLTLQTQHRISNSEKVFPFSEIILVARKPSSDEIAMAKKFGYEFDVRPIARDGLIFLVHRQNEVNDLSLEQIRSIYLSRNYTANWKNFGGIDSQISIIERNRNSGSRELMDELVLTDASLEKAGHPNEQNGSSITRAATMTASPWSNAPAELPNRPTAAPQVPVADHSVSIVQPTTPVIRVLEPLPTELSSAHANAPVAPAPPTLFGTISVPNQEVVKPQTPQEESPKETQEKTPPLTPEQRVELRNAWDQFRSNRPNAVSGGMGGPYLAVAENTQGISYSVNYYEHFMVCVPNCRVIAVDGVIPNHETIRTKKYPLVSDVYVVTLKGIADDSPPAKLRDWLLSEDGQRCIRESGYVSNDN